MTLFIRIYFFRTDIASNIQVPISMVQLQIADLDEGWDYEFMKQNVFCDKVDHPVMEKKQVLGFRQPNIDP